MIDTFDQKTFERKMGETLGVELLPLGVEKGEYTYLFPLDTHAGIKIRSSIQESTGLSGNTGKDSLRCWLAWNASGDPLGSKLGKWTSREPGWDKRLAIKIHSLATLKDQGGNCPVCHLPRGIWKTRKTGKWFAKCWDHETDCVWLDPEKEEKEMNNLDILEEIIQEETPIAEKSFSLNSFQQAVVDNLGKGPQVIEAIPGSGKTRTLENLVARILQEGGDPHRIGFFTFTRKAAEEARRRIARTLMPDLPIEHLQYLEKMEGDAPLDLDQEDPIIKFILERVSTIHALNFRLLKWRDPSRKWNVLSGPPWEWKERELIRDLLGEMDWEEEGVNSIHSWISLAINNLITPPHAEQFFSDVLQRKNGPLWRAKDLARLYRDRQDFMKAHNLIDFDMMQARVRWLLDNDPSFKEWAAGLFDYILIDEAQDTSDLQASIIFDLGIKTGNVIFCGDVDQSMYAWRGARPDVMRDIFQEKWGDVKRFDLPINYRSTKAIVRWAENLIGWNYKEDATYLKGFTPREDAPEGDPITYTEFELFSLMTEEISNVVAEEPGRFFILSRTRAECSAIHTALLARNIPAINKSGGLLFGSPHIRKTLAYARMSCNYQDAKDNMEIVSEIANVASSNFRAPMTRRKHQPGCDNTKSWVDCGCPVIREEGIDYCHSRYYGKKALEEATTHKDGMWKGIVSQTYEQNRGGYPTPKAKGAQDLVSFVGRLEKISSDAQHTLNIIIQECILPWLKVEEGLSQEDLSENGKQEDFDLLINLCHPEMTMEEFLAEIDKLAAGSSEDGDETHSVLIGTIHWSKGAERPEVIVNTTRLPIIPPSTPPNKLPSVSEPPTMEEERRLLHVAGTRAQEKLYLFGSREWNEQKMETSLFIQEIGMI